MHRNLLLLALALAAGSAHAQTAPTITAADMPMVGDSLRVSQALTLPTTAPPLTRNGANQTWNYAGLTPAAQRVVRYNEVSSAAGPLVQFTFNNPLFSPDTRATLASPQSLPLPAGTTITLPITDPLEFSSSTAADFRSVGFSATLSGTAVPVTYASKAQQDVIYRFPLSYGGGSDISNSFLATPAIVASSGYFSQKRQRTNQPDAWGTLTTPFGTFQTLRVVTTLADHDSLAIGGAPGQGLTLPLIRQYKWLANGVHVPVLTITTTEAAGQQTVAAVEYRDSYRRVTTLATRDAATDATLSAYPNPSAVGTGLRLAVPASSGAFTLSATDLVGRQLFSQRFSGSPSGAVTVEAAAFGAFRGVMLLTVQTGQGTATRRVVRQ
jgi:hypothetical protein